MVFVLPTLFPLILASTSERRQSLLALLDIPFVVMSVDIDETWHENEPAHDYIMRMVHEKSLRAIGQMDCQSATIITADTIGVLASGEVLTKPCHKDDAFVMWRKMSGTQHEVWTAAQVSVIANNQLVWQKDKINKTCVHFVEMSKQDMSDYWQTGEPMDKAGGYAIQGKGARFVKAICGNYTNVVGLPLPDVVALIDEANAFIQTINQQ